MVLLATGQGNIIVDALRPISVQSSFHKSHKISSSLHLNIESFTVINRLEAYSIQFQLIMLSL